MAPERTSPSNEVTEAADIYSMGLVLYELLAGKMPFHSETARGYINCHLLEDPEPLAEAAPETSSLPPALHTLIERLLEKEPDERPQIAEEVVFALNGILSLLEPTPPAQMRAVLAESLRRRKG